MDGMISRVSLHENFASKNWRLANLDHFQPPALLPKWKLIDDIAIDIKSGLVSGKSTRAENACPK